MFSSKSQLILKYGSKTKTINLQKQEPITLSPSDLEGVSQIDFDMTNVALISAEISNKPTMEPKIEYMNDQITFPSNPSDLSELNIQTKNGLLMSTYTTGSRSAEYGLNIKIGGYVPLYIQVRTKSDDVLEWTKNTSGQSLKEVIWVNNKFYGVYSDYRYTGGKYVYSTHFYSSTDGKSWSKISTISTDMEVRELIYANNRFVVVGHGGSYNSSSMPRYSPKIFYSTDLGVTWNEAIIPSGADSIESIAYGKNMFIAVGYNGTCIKSTDATASNWEFVRDMENSKYYQEIVFFNNRFIVTSHSDYAHNLTSTNGVDWEQYKLPCYYSCVWLAAGKNESNQDLLIANPCDRCCYISTDGINWGEKINAHNLDTSTGGATFNMLYGDRFVAGYWGNNDYAESKDGVHWKTIYGSTRPTPNSKNNIAYSPTLKLYTNGSYIGVPKVYGSWTYRNTPNYSYTNKILYGANTLDSATIPVPEETSGGYTREFYFSNVLPVSCSVSNVPVSKYEPLTPRNNPIPCSRKIHWDTPGPTVDENLSIEKQHSYYNSKGWHYLYTTYCQPKVSPINYPGDGTYRIEYKTALSYNWYDQYYWNDSTSTIHANLGMTRRFVEGIRGQDIFMYVKPYYSGYLISD